MKKKILTKEIAEQFLEDEEVDLSEFTSIEDAAAESLSKHIAEYQGHSLDLDGLTSLSDAAAESLSKSKEFALRAQIYHSLSLNGLKRLSDATAKSFSKINEGLDRYTTCGDDGTEPYSLSLNGLTELSDEAGKLLSKMETGCHSLYALLSLPDELRHKVNPYAWGNH